MTISRFPHVSAETSANQHVRDDNKLSNTWRLIQLPRGAWYRSGGVRHQMPNQTRWPVGRDPYYGTLLGE